MRKISGDESRKSVRAGLWVVLGLADYPTGRIHQVAAVGISDERPQAERIEKYRSDLRKH